MFWITALCADSSFHSPLDAVYSRQQSFVGIYIQMRRHSPVCIPSFTAYMYVRSLAYGSHHSSASTKNAANREYICQTHARQLKSAGWETRDRRDTGNSIDPGSTTHATYHMASTVPKYFPQVPNWNEQDRSMSDIQSTRRGNNINTIEWYCYAMCIPAEFRYRMGVHYGGDLVAYSELAL